MWILESTGDFFQGRRMWLKPGKQYLFGRVKSSGVQFALASKTVSRKHFVITVDDVRDEDVASTFARTKITVIDQKSKVGTTVNGQLLKDSSRILSLAENIIRPGGEEDIIVRWQPCVLTYNLLKKEIKAGVLETKQQRVKDLDIKAVAEYVTDTTTHVVANKRNTVKGLQALISGRWLVAESFIAALEYASTPSDLTEEENLCPLEQDFDQTWPNEADHLPPAGKEPTLRPAESYQPNVNRSNIFNNFTFVFCDPNQHSNLLPAISSGHGKALLYNIEPGQTTPEDLIKYLQNAAGSKGFGDTRKTSDKGAVILVRWTEADHEEWSNALINQVALKLDQRAIDQSEFLDAILANDALLLRQAVPYESLTDGVVAPQGTAVSAISLTPIDQPATLINSSSEITSQYVNRQTQESLPSTNIPSTNGHNSEHRHTEAPSSPIEESAPAPIKRARFVLSKPKSGRVIDFDDDFDPNAILPIDDGNQEEAVDSLPHSRSEISTVPSQAQSDADDGYGYVQNGSATTRKRPRSVDSDIQENANEDADEELFPGAAAMKRRKLARGEMTKGDTNVTIKSKPRTGVILPGPKSLIGKDIDIKEELKANRGKEKDAVIKKEGDDNDDNDLTLDENGRLPVYEVITELMELRVRKPSTSETEQPENDRWDPKWNGRKNFKAFRRARDRVNGTEENRKSRHTRVIVPLVDAKQSTYGIGDQYWDKPEEDKQQERAMRKRASQRTTQSENHGSSNHTQLSNGHGIRHADDSSVEEQSMGERDDTEQPSPRVTRLQQEAADILDHEIVVDEPRRTRADDRTQTQTATGSSTKTTRGTKRPATTIGRRNAATDKRQKTLPVTTIRGSDSDDSDDMKFRFGTGRRRKATTATATAAQS